MQRARGYSDEPISVSEESRFLATAEASQRRLYQLISELLQRWYWIALFSVIGLVLAFYFLSRVDPKFSANSSILVKTQTNAVISGDRGDELDLKTLDALNTIAQRIERFEVFQAVAQAPKLSGVLGLIPSQKSLVPTWLGGKPDTVETTIEESGLSNDEFAKMLSDWTEVQVRRKTRLVDIKVTHPSPQVAVLLANLVAGTFIDDLSASRASGRSSDQAVFLSQSEAARTSLQSAQNALANYKRALETLRSLEMKELAMSEIIRRYLPKHPKYIAAKSDLQDYESRFLEEFESIRAANADLEYWQKNREEIEAARLETAARLNVARRLLTARVLVLESEIESKTQVFNSLLTNLQETDINSQTVETEAQLNSKARLPDEPASPKTLVVLGGGLLIGGGSGLLFALVLTRLDNKVHNVERATEVTDLPVLGSLAKLPLARIESLLKRESEGRGASTTSKHWSPRLVFRDELSDTTYAESFRILRAAVSLLRDRPQSKITLFSSSIPAEGKTTIAANYALSVAQQGSRTLLIDLDLRRPAVHKVFGLLRRDIGPGLTEVLAGQVNWREIVREESGQENLHLILAGAKAPNPGELLNGDRLSRFLVEAAKEYDEVVVDSAPVLAVADTRIVASLVDNFALVVNAETVPKGALRRTMEILSEDGSIPDGIVVNSLVTRKRFGSSRENYYGAYGYGSDAYGVYGAEEDNTKRL